MRSTVFIAACLAAGFGAPSARDEVEIPALELVLQLPAIEELAQDLGAAGQRRGLWTGQLGDAQLRIELIALDQSYGEPDDVAAVMVRHMAQADPDFEPEDELFTGPYGWAEFAVLLEGALHEGETPVGRQWLMCGLLPEAGYVVSVECKPEPDKAGAAAVREFLTKGVRYTGAVRDANWTNDEVRERWLRDAPKDTHDGFLKDLSKSGTAKKAVIRTDHYLILTNSSGGKLFAKKMEENFKEITRIFPYEDVKGRRLMPVFLFRTPDQYYDYYAAIANQSREHVSKSKGHAWRDYYATWYEAPGDPVHIHECTHQFFSNRLHLSGGGSWLQEGVAEYVESSENDRNEVARAVKKGDHTKLRELVALESLLYSSEDDVRGGSKASDNYKQAALFVEFLRESRFAKEQFSVFLARMGRVRRGDVEAIEAVFEEIYGEDLDGIDGKFMEYCKKR